jgi:hypothetical protein
VNRGSLRNEVVPWKDDFSLITETILAFFSKDETTGETDRYSIFTLGLGKTNSIFCSFAELHCNKVNKSSQLC